ncbi:MAG: GNAT family N-acetyltransferase [Nocardioides sp.]
MRPSLTLRKAEPEDVDALVELWGSVMRKADREDLVVDAREIVADCERSTESCIVVAEVDGVVAGSVYLRATTLTPVNLEPVVQALHPHVAPRFQGRGVGKALIEAAVTYAEDRGIGHVASAALTGSRDANRFMARLALGPMATLRLAPATAVRAKLSANGRGVQAPSRQLSQVLAARRSLRRSRGAEADPGLEVTRFRRPAPARR